MINVEDCLLIEKNSLYKYAFESDEPMLKAVMKEEVIYQGKTKQDIKQERTYNFDNKDMHSIFFKKTELRDKFIAVLDKQKRTCMITDVACPFDTRVQEKEEEKIERYNDLKWELIRNGIAVKSNSFPLSLKPLAPCQRASKAGSIPSVQT